MAKQRASSHPCKAPPCKRLQLERRRRRWQSPSTVFPYQPFRIILLKNNHQSMLSNPNVFPTPNSEVFRRDRNICLDWNGLKFWTKQGHAIDDYCQSIVCFSLKVRMRRIFQVAMTPWTQSIHVELYLQGWTGIRRIETGNDIY